MSLFMFKLYSNSNTCYLFLRLYLILCDCIDYFKIIFDLTLEFVYSSICEWWRTCTTLNCQSFYGVTGESIQQVNNLLKGFYNYICSAASSLESSVLYQFKYPYSFLTQLHITQRNMKTKKGLICKSAGHYVEPVQF